MVADSGREISYKVLCFCVLFKFDFSILEIILLLNIFESLNSI